MHCFWARWLVRELLCSLSWSAESGQCSQMGRLLRGDGHPVGAVAVLALLAHPGELSEERRDGRAAKEGTWHRCMAQL